MKKFLLFAGAGVLGAVVIGLGAIADGGDNRPGSPAVYDRIAATTDCAELQAMFDRAADNHDTAQPGSAETEWTLGYMEAADDRMESVGCYG